MKNGILPKLTSIFFLVVGAILVSAGVSHPFRCGTHLVSDGDIKAQVIHKCSEPDVIDSWEEERIYRDFRFERENGPVQEITGAIGSPFSSRKM